MDRKRRKTKDLAVEGGSKSNVTDFNAHPMEFSEDGEEDDPEVIDDLFFKNIRKQTLTRNCIVNSTDSSFCFYRHSPINLMVELERLNRKKDVVCLILSYPPFNSFDKERHKSWIMDVLEINHKVRELEASSKGKETNAQKVLSYEITRLLDHSTHDIEDYVPSFIINKMLKKNLVARTPEREVLDLAIDFTVRQILQDLGIPELRRIGISGRDDKSLMSRLMNLPGTKEAFNIVIQIDVSSCCTIGEIEHSIVSKLGLSRSSRQEADELLKSKNFLILLDGFDPGMNLYEVGTNWWNSKNIQKIVYRCGSLHRFDPTRVGLGIRLEDHLLSWELFCWNIGEVLHSSSIQCFAIHLLKQYRILFNALTFIRRGLGSADQCLKHCTSYVESSGTDKIDLIGRWVQVTLVGTLDEGEKVVGDLVNAFLLESSQKGNSIRMRHEIRVELINLYETEMNPILVKLHGRGLTEAPKLETWTDVTEMHLMNNKISKLPEYPNCPKLSLLFLQDNHHLRVIPPHFFECMPVLKVLDLSQTRIRSLPQFFFKLVQLQKFFLRGCELFMELPQEVGELHYLEVLDLDGTEIITLPVAIGKLANLTCLKVSFHEYNDSDRKNCQSNRIIPQNWISNLLQLKELSIDVNPNDRGWNVIVKDIVKEICSLAKLEALKLYLPEVVLLNYLRSSLSSLKHFRFTVGHHEQRIISRLPLEAAYVNGKGVQIEIKEALQHVATLFLDRHLTLTSLSKFGIGNMENLKFCLLGECNEIQTIVDAGNDGDVLLGSLEYLNLHYMKNLRSIWKGPLCQGSLFSLKSLVLYTCPQLTTIFTFNLLKNLGNLEELVVEDCPEINSIVTHDVPAEFLPRWICYLPNLKKISLHYLPKLISFSSGEPIAPMLEWLSVYDCPRFRTLGLLRRNLKVIIGERDWWNALLWKKSEQLWLSNRPSIFVPIVRDKDLTTQLAEINYQLPARMQRREPSQQAGLQPAHSSLMNGSKLSLNLKLCRPLLILYKKRKLRTSRNSVWIIKPFISYLFE
ncbi:hypothetical protein PVL29_015876 [Vitis rotundifolia]|uniref:Uncharacterized protein n=1 Tax=Vitis rotundifolia TaxID=103349 RepID=A0AA38ZDU1_VITRO|nr:hypothetical protein PVL29_015876 [Vitis rotundifolia]